MRTTYCIEVLERPRAKCLRKTVREARRAPRAVYRILRYDGRTEEALRFATGGEEDAFIFDDGFSCSAASIDEALEMKPK